MTNTVAEISEICEINGPLQDETILEMVHFLNSSKNNPNYREVEAPRLLRRTYGLNSNEAMEVFKIYRETMG